MKWRDLIGKMPIAGARVGRKAANGDFVRRRRYKLSLVNMSSLRTVFEFRARRLGMAIGASALFLLAGGVWLMVFLYTPLRNVLPVKMNSELREDYVDLSARLDSAAAAAAVNDRYASNLMAILQEAESPEAPVGEEMSQPLPLDSLLEASDDERSFVRRFEDQERYNLSVLSPIAAEGMVFYAPFSGLEVEQKVSESGIPYASAAPARFSAVSAIYRGTVVTTYFTTSKGITVVVQHPNEFVSIYSGLAEVFVARGEKVAAGTRLGMGMADRYPLTFELWHNGSPLPAEEYILF